MTRTLIPLVLLVLAGCNPLTGSPILGHWTLDSDATASGGSRIALELTLTDDGIARFTRVEDWTSGCVDNLRLDGTFQLPDAGRVSFRYTGGWYVVSSSCIGGAYNGDPPPAELDWRSVTQPWSTGQNTLTLGEPIPATYIGD